MFFEMEIETSRTAATKCTKGKRNVKLRKHIVASNKKMFIVCDAFTVAFLKHHFDGDGELSAGVAPFSPEMEGRGVGSGSGSSMGFDTEAFGVAASILICFIAAPGRQGNISGGVNEIFALVLGDISR